MAPVIERDRREPIQMSEPVNASAASFHDQRGVPKDPRLMGTAPYSPAAASRSMQPCNLSLIWQTRLGFIRSR